MPSHRLSTRRARLLTGIVAALAVAGGSLTGGGPAGAATSTPSCVIAAGSGVSVTAGGAAVGTVDVLDPLAQVLPAKRIAGASVGSLCAAKNAYASFQLEISANKGAALTGVKVTSTDLTGPNNAKLRGSSATSPAVRFAREDYVKLGNLSDGELDPARKVDTVTPDASLLPRSSTGVCSGDCRFPDQLIPDRDPLTNEIRNAFTSLTIPSGENRVIWTDILVPSTATAGTYSGTMTVTAGNGAVASVQVALQVVDAVLPSTSTLHTTFFADNTQNDKTAYQQMAELGLDARISVVPDSLPGGSVGASQPILLPLIQGKDTKVALPGAALTTFAMSVGGELAQAYKPMFATAGVVTKPWAYCDEIAASLCASQYATVKKAWPGLPLIAIRQPRGGGWSDPKDETIPAGLVASAVGTIDIVQWLQPVDRLIPENYHGDHSDRAPVEVAWAKQQAGREAWVYTSNTSGGGGTYNPATPMYYGEASLGVDQVASEQVALPWQAYNEGLQGQLYWSVNQDQATSMDARKSGLVGDGTLFYPADQTKVSGSKTVTESLRLRRIRNSMQDYELLKKAADQTKARSISTGLFPALDKAAVAPSTYAAAEQSLYRLFTLPANPSTPTTAVDRRDLDRSGTPDFVAVQKSTGDLLFYPRTAVDWAADGPKRIGSEYGTTTATLAYQALLLAGDLTSDGKPDLLGSKADGTLVRIDGNGDGTLSSIRTALSTTTTRPVAVGDFTGDKKPDLLDVHIDGTLWLLAGTGAGTFSATTQAGAGWGALDLVGVRDFNKDGFSDVVARTSAGALLLYEGNGAGGWKTVDGGIGMGVTLSRTAYPTLIGAGDLTGDGKPDLVAIDSAGAMFRLTGNGGTGFTGGLVQIGSGWGSSNLSQIAG